MYRARDEASCRARQQVLYCSTSVYEVETACSCPCLCWTRATHWRCYPPTYGRRAHGIDSTCSSWSEPVVPYPTSRTRNRQLGRVIVCPRHQWNGRFKAGYGLPCQAVCLHQSCATLIRERHRSASSSCTSLSSKETALESPKRRKK